MEIDDILAILFDKQTLTQQQSAFLFNAIVNGTL